LAGGVAHDFNNLLSVIINYATFVADATTNDAAVHDDVEQIQFAAERAAALTRQLLLFARRETTEPEVLDLNVVMYGVESMLSRSLGAHIDFRAISGTELPSILADRSQIEQVLLNLAVNARDAMPEGGVLTIETRHVYFDDEDEMEYSDLAPGTYVQLTVSDTGVGMSEAVQSKIFEPFFTTKSAGEGTGLGLATVYGVVSKFGGTVHVYSEVGVGTTFRVYFPAHHEAFTSETSLASAGPSGHGEVILVVDDEPGVLEFTTRILRQAGYPALSASSAEEALAIASDHSFDLLLTDSVMPHVSGQSLSEQLAALHPGRGLLFMSGHSESVFNPNG
jgi:hypothetical protein